MARHGARSHYFDSPNLPEGYFGEGVEPGYVTSLGRSQHMNHGLNRRKEYIRDKKLLSEEFNEKEILSLSTFKQRCAVSGEFFIHGMYPLQDVTYKSDNFYHKVKNSPIRKTSYDEILSQMDDQCQVGPVIQVPHKYDIMMHTRNCQKVHDYLNKDQWDMEQLLVDLKEEFGLENFESTKDILEKYFQKDVKEGDIRMYFEMLDARVAELKQGGGGLEMMNMQRQECFILANNFIGPDQTFSKVYLSRMIIPFSQVFASKVLEDIQGKTPSDLKYLIFNLHDTNVSNLLRFLGYWNKFGYQKHVKFGSTVRFEIIKPNMKNRCPNREFKQTMMNKFEQYRLRIVYDDEEIHLPFCQSLYCTFGEWSNYLNQNLMQDLKKADEFCKS